MNLELGRDIKESIGICCAEGALIQAEQRLSILPTTPYELPDGTNVDMGIERYQVSELFFDRAISNDVEIDNLFSASNKLPTIMPLTSDNLPQMIQNSLYRCEIDGSTSSMWQNIIVSGGNSCYRGFQERLKFELELKSQNSRVKIHAASDIERTSEKADKMKSVVDRAICPWLGGSIMGSLGSFHDIWISKKDYDEYGPSIVDNKCP
jgi:actin-related protein